MAPATPRVVGGRRDGVARELQRCPLCALAESAARGRNQRPAHRSPSSTTGRSRLAEGSIDASAGALSTTPSRAAAQLARRAEQIAATGQPRHTSTPSTQVQLLELRDHEASMAWRLTSRTGAHVPDTGACSGLEGPHVAPEGVGLPALRSECKGGSAQANRCQCNEHTRHESNFFWLSSLLGRNDRATAEPAFR